MPVFLGSKWNTESLKMGWNTSRKDIQLIHIWVCGLYYLSGQSCGDNVKETGWGLMCNLVFIRACSDISLKQINKFRLKLGAIKVHNKDSRKDVSPDMASLFDEEGKMFCKN